MKKALIVGIDKYESNKINDLRGCVNDAKDIVKLLINKYNYQKDNIVMLLDYDATFDNITDELQALVENSKENDELIFYNSSHGSQVIDLDCDENDGLDEILITTDHSWKEPLTDDILHDIIININKKAIMWIIIDSCHSGTGVRDLKQQIQESHDDELMSFLSIAKQHNKYTQSRFIAPPIEIMKKMTIAKEKNKIKHYNKLKSMEIFENVQDMVNYTLISASKDNQLSNETMTLSGDVRGLFTYFFVEAIRKDVENKLTIEEIVIIVAKQIKLLYGYDQTPQVQGNVYFKDSNFLS